MDGMPADRPRTPDHRKAIALGSFAAFVLIVLASKIIPSAPPHAEADPILLSDQVGYTPVLDTHLSGLVVERPGRTEGQFVRFEPGAAAPWHSHRRSYVGLLVSGVMRNPFAADDAAPTIAPGAYWYVPSEAKHISACVSDKPCLAYVRFGPRVQTAAQTEPR